MVTTTSLGVTCSARQPGADRCLQPHVARRTTDGKSKQFLRGPMQSLRIPIAHAVSLPPVPEPKALEPESQEPECTPLPRTPPVLGQRHKGQCLQSTTPSTLSAHCLWMSWRPRLLLLFSFVSTQAFPLVADSLVCFFQDFVPSCVVAAAGGLVSGYLAACSPH